MIAGVPAVNPGEDAARGAVTDPLELVGLPSVLAMTRGTPEIVVGLVDGPVAARHAGFKRARIRGFGAGTLCDLPDSAACAHGTFMAGIMVADRESAAPGICCDCTLLVRPIFREHGVGMPSASAEEAARAIVECVDAGADVINLSAATGEPTTRKELALKAALDYAAGRRVLVVAAAGNQAALGSSEVTRHPGVVPVAAYDLAGRPVAESNLGRSVGRWGVGAPPPTEAIQTSPGPSRLPRNRLYRRRCSCTPSDSWSPGFRASRSKNRKGVRPGDRRSGERRLDRSRDDEGRALPTREPAPDAQPVLGLCHRRLRDIHPHPARPGRS
ncbi:MAG: S8 family serine peptidase [Solirubrobacteraceae bacterium]